LGRFQLRTWVTLLAVAAAATASAALADGYDNAVANCGQSVLEQPFLSFGDSA
jgi:hypothetical protein